MATTDPKDLDPLDRAVFEMSTELSHVLLQTSRGGSGVELRQLLLDLEGAAMEVAAHLDDKATYTGWADVTD